MSNRNGLALAVNGEKMSTQYLQEAGYNIISTNYYSTYGEIDIVALDTQEIVIVEVKTRSGNSLRFAENSISSKKQKRLTLSAIQFISENPEYSGLSVRFDAVIILYCRKDDTYQINHLKNAFMPQSPEGEIG